MTVVIAGERRIVPARIPGAVVDGVVPVIIVIGVLSIPAAVVRLQRVMCPALAGISVSHCNSLTPKSKRPNVRHMRVLNARLNRRELLWLRRRLDNSVRLRQRIVNDRIAFDTRYFPPGGQCLGHLPTALHQHRIHNVEGPMLDATLTQPLQDWALRGVGLV